MKGKASRQSHKAANTFRFRGFGEKVRALRISARKYLLQRPKNLDGEDTTFFYEAIIKARELNVTEHFTTFLRELGREVQTTNQLVLHEERIVECLSNHISIAESMALQPLFDLLVAFSNDLPQEFYKKYFYNFLPKLVAHLKTKDPEQIESVFLCIVSLFVVLQKYLREDLFTLYHVHDYSSLLSKSYPWYINELAAQSLGVLVRKMPKKDDFISMSLKKLRKDESQVEGLGRVYASMIKSDVIQRLHSCTPKILSRLLEFLKGDNEVPQELALATVKYTALLIARYVTTPHPDKSVRWENLWKEDSSFVWPTLWRCVKDLLSLNNSEVNSHLNCVLQVIQVFITHKQGALIIDVDDTVSNCLAVMKSELPDSIGNTISEILATLLNLPQETLPVSVLQEIISVFLSSTYSPFTKFLFMKRVVDFERFDNEILPLFLPYLDELMGSSQDSDTHKGILEFIATVAIQKQPPCTSGMELGTWKPYILDFSKAGVTEKGHIGSFIENRIKEGFLDISNLENLSLYLICLPHIMHLNHQDLAPFLSWILNDAMTSLKDEAQKVVESDKPSLPKKRKSDVVSPPISFDMNIKASIPLHTRKILFLIGLLIEVMSHIFSREDFLSTLGQLELVQLIKRKHHYRENIHILRAVDIHFTIASIENEKTLLTEEFMQELYSYLAPSLSSANPQVRYLVLHIFSLFPVTLPPPPENVDNSENIFQIMLKAESEAVTPWEIRDRLRYITMVDADHVKPHLPISGTFDQAPLLFFIGQLYTNFKDLWNPILKAISGFAHTMPVETFWPLWFSKLKIASHITHEVLLRKQVDNDTSLHLSCSLLSAVNDRLSLHAGYSKLPQKPDHLNFRDLLWRAMEKFHDVCETKNRDLVPLFFEFVEKEFFPLDFTVSPTQDISAKSWQGLNETENNSQSFEESMEVDVDNKFTEEEMDDDEECPDYPKRASVQSLCGQLTLFSKFHNPRMLSQANKLETMYQELLTHPSPRLQKLSFDCLMSYNHSFLVPYKDHLYRILEDKSFKNALTLFSIDGSEKILEDDHRKDLMPYLLRILYGKMHFKTGSNTAGKNKTNVRKGVILRFLAGASEEEFQTFLDLAFDVLLGYLNGTALEVVKRSRENLDLHHVVPLNRLQGAITTMENILERIANKMTMKKSLLLKIILYITNVSTMILERRDEVRKKLVSYLKHIRQQAQKLLVSFFSLEDYSWQPEEIDAVFEVMVWPNLRRLPDEGLLSPTSLLNLFECWAEIPRYFPLLAKVHKNDKSLTPLTYITKLVANEKCSSKVTSVIFNMIEKLLTLKDHDETVSNEEGKSLPLVVCPPTVEVIRLKSRDGLTQQNYGSALLVPHLDGLLESMKNLLTNLSKGASVSQRDLTILTNLTEWVTNKSTSEDLLSVIIPLIVKQHVKEDEIISELLTTCSLLLPVIDNSNQFLRPLITLFGCLEGRASRNALCRAIEAVATVNPELKEFADLANDLNAWDRKIVDEPDYDRRLKGYKQLGEYCKNETSISLEYCQFIVFNNMFVICHIEDSSLRDLSRLCLDQLIDMCVRLQPTYPGEVKSILMDRLLSLVKAGLKNKKEEVRQDTFFVLQKIVHKCHSFYEKLKDLYKLSDEKDEDVDFFSNMMHIQRHRRSRALMRLADKVKKGVICLTPETITDYLMPSVRVYLFNDVYAKDDHLAQSAVCCIGAFASVLPWYPYLRLLKTYATSLTKQDIKYHRLSVRLLEAVIDGFHEDVEEVKVFEGEKDLVNKGTDTQVEKESKEKVTKEVLTTKAGKEATAEENIKLPKEPSTEVSEESEMKEIELADLPVTADDDKMSKPQKVYLAVVNNIIPHLKKTLGSRTKGDIRHKVNKSKYPEDEEIKRIPLAYAVIKLMKKLPPKVLDANVSSVLMKMITFLKSQSQSIRDEARAMLVKIMVDLGGKYLECLVSDMRSILVRGFQTHVLVFTLHSVLSQMRPVLCASHIDSCVVDIMEICKEDLLGFQEEEKKVAKITTKVKEARYDKSYAVINFAAGLVSVVSLGDLVIPLKEVLASTQDSKIVNKLVRCLNEICTGLERNENIELVQKSVFIYGLINEKVSALTSSNKKTHEDSSNKKIHRVDYCLLEPEPKKAKLVPKTTIETTSHLFIEFALRLFSSLLRREKFNSEDKEHLKLLDPYVPVMVKCLNSEYPDISQYTLKCINFLVRFPLPSLKINIGSICSEMFVILHKYSSPELTKGKIFELVQLTFRSLALIIKTVDYYVLKPEEVRVLLQYVQESLDDSNHHNTVFPVLQSVVARKIDIPELHELMEAVKKMSVVCTRQYALNQGRVTYYSYLLTYPMKRKVITKNILYYLGNISYSVEEGRLSAQMFVNGVITNFPVKLFYKELETSLWLKLSEQLVKEEFKENRLLLHKSLKTLFERSERKSYLLELCMKLFGEDDASESVESSAVPIQLSCKSLNAFLDIPVKKMPLNILSLIAPKIVPLINPARYSAQMRGVIDQNEDAMEEVGAGQFHDVDNALVVLLEVLTKLASLFLSSSSWKKYVGDDFWRNVQSLLFYPHIQVRLNVVGLIGQLLAAFPVEGPEVPVLCSSTEKARSLVLDLCEVLQTEAKSEFALMTQLYTSVVRNLIYLIRNAIRVSLVKDSVSDEAEDDMELENEYKENENKDKEKDPVAYGALWILGKVGNVAYKELQLGRRECTVVREAFLNLIAGVVVVVGDKLQTPALLSYIIKHFARELSDKRLPEKLVSRTQEVANLVKDHIGVEEYTRHFTTAQVGLAKKRLGRKALEKQQKIVNPHNFSKKKKKKRLASAVAKKIAIAEKRGKFVSKKKMGKLRENAFITE